ncbi:MAG TPA: hypothetical protein VHV26_06540 [Rhizomicrobium sp.]|jgi:hypothetical protein|nr:hypothetical protein [Rhizomicrobium sp.]
MVGVDVTFDNNLTLNPVQLDPVTLEPVTVAAIQKIAPVGVHIKEFNQVAPLSVESLRVDHVRHVDPLRIERLDITRLPSVNITMSQLPGLDLNVRRVPPVAITIQQQFDLWSDYAITARFLGVPLLRMALTGRTNITPHGCARREHSHSHERSFPDVAAAGNPAIPSSAVEVCAGPAGHRHHRSKPCVRAGAPRFGYSLRHGSIASEAQSTVNGG